jgi:hypothetical protein
VSASLQWQVHSLEFYACIGLCILNYQEIEDSLASVFSIALRAEPAEAEALFTPAGKDLSKKFQFINIALASRNCLEERQLWDGLSAKIQQAAEKRHTLAHSEAVIFGGGIAIDLEGNLPARRLGPQQWQAHKKQKNGRVEWTIDDLKAYTQILKDLEKELRDFVNALRNKNVNVGGDKK